MKYPIADLKSPKFIFCFLSAASIFAFLHFFFVPQDAFAATNIVSPNQYAWNDALGWIDFGSTGTVNVYNSDLEGYANSQVGYVALNCNSTPNGNICGASPFQVSNDGNGNLSGWAWNDTVGWISFASSSPVYQVSINPATGDWSGWAWNDTVGWISFNCQDPGICGTSNYKVNTSWRTVPKTGNLESSIYDTQDTGGSAINTIMWQGTGPNGTAVEFQIASANCSNGASNPPTCSIGTWSYLGPDGSGSTYYGPAAPGTPLQINLAQHNNKRYFRYKIFLWTDTGQTQSPTVDDVILNWSP